MRQALTEKADSSREGGTWTDVLRVSRALAFIGVGSVAASSMAVTVVEFWISTFVDYCN